MTESKIYLDARRFLASWAMGPWHFNFVISSDSWLLKILRDCLQTFQPMPHPPNLNLPEYFSCCCIHVFDGGECESKECTGLLDHTYIHAYTHTSISHLSFLAKLSLLSILVPKMSKMIKPKHQYIKDFLLYTEVS